MAGTKSQVKRTPTKKSSPKKSPKKSVKRTPTKKSPAKKMTVSQKVKSLATKSNAKKAAGIAGLIAALGGAAIAYNRRDDIKTRGASLLEYVRTRYPSVVDSVKNIFKSGGNKTEAAKVVAVEAPAATPAEQEAIVQRGAKEAAMIIKSSGLTVEQRKAMLNLK